MSFGFSVGDFIAIIQLANKARKDFAGAPDQFKSISDELRALSIVLQDIDTNLSDYDLSASQESSLQEINTSCQHLLKDVQNTIKKYSNLEVASTSFRGSVRRSWQRLKWEPEDVRELRSRITSNITLLNTFLGGLNSHATFATKQGVDRLNQRQDDEERDAILNWLTPVNYADQQNDFLGRRQAGTGQWLLDSDEYRQWVTTPGKTLFCPGIPGAGKTILASIVIDDILTRVDNDEAVGIAYLYCNFRRHDEQKVVDLIASLLKQLSYGLPQLPGEVKTMYEKHRKQQTRPSVEELIGALNDVTARYSHIFVVVDALDECQPPDRTELLLELFNLQSKRQLNLFATSRFIPEIVQRFTRSSCLSQEIRASSEDVGRYLKAHLSHLPAFVARDASLQDEIKNAIIQAVDGMFLLAQLHLNSLKGKRSPKALRETLRRLASGSEAYNQAYDDAMERIEGQLKDQEELAKQVLSWIVCAKRPLKTVELQHALGIELGIHELDLANLPEVEDMVSVCVGLVTIDEESSIIRLVHYTTQEYFERTKETWFPDAEYDIMRACITYLSFDVFDSGFCHTDYEFEERLRSNKLYDYATHHSDVYAHVAQKLRQEAIDFLQAQKKVESACQAMLAIKYYSEHQNYSAKGQGMTGLHLAAFLGVNLVQELLAIDTSSLKVQDNSGRAPFWWAAEGGNIEVVKLLLEKGADPSDANNDGWTPLHSAAVNGHVEVVRLLLEKGVDLAITDNDGWTPLHSAASNGRVEMVQLLLERGANLAIADKHGETPLNSAAKWGRVEVVKLLLEKGADLDVADKHGQTSLHWVVMFRHVEVVKLLLEKGADLAIADNYGWTPLDSAVNSGYVEVVKLLLEKGANPSVANNDGWTPLHRAASNGHVNTIRMLLDKGANVNQTSLKSFQTALSYAIIRRHTEAAKVLLHHDSIELDLQDKAQRSPLFWASEAGDIDVVEMLCSREGVDIDTQDQYGSTPLSIASRHGYLQVVCKLLETKKVVINTSDCFGRTPLWYARRYQHDDVADVLLKAMEKSDIIESDSEMPTDQGPGEFDERETWCNICTMNIREGQCYYRCTACKDVYWDFDICLGCYKGGGRCFDSNHDLVRQEAAESSDKSESESESG